MTSPRTDEALVLDEVTSLYVDLHSRPPAAVRLDSNLRSDLGFDSLAMVELVDRVGEAAGVVLGENVLTDSETPADLARAVQEARAAGHRLPPATPKVAGPVSRLAPQREATRSSAGLDLDAQLPPTLTAALVEHAKAHPEQVTVRLLGSDATAASEDITYGALLSESQTVASALIDAGLSFGERVAIMLPTERAYFTTFCGILLAGGVPVPLYPPARRAVLAEHLTSLAGVLRNAGASALVTVPEAMAAARLLAVQVPSMRSVRTPADLMQHGDAHALLPEVQADDLALIQYTSGSTGDPKGVVLTHAQLLANMRAMARGAQLTSEDVVVSWLPLYHDMGLIGVWHTPLVFGIPFVVMSPLTFLARPVRWLEAISSYRGTISAAPNFAYKACTERIADAELAGLDLSCWRLAFNGSEPVSWAVVDGFTKRFAAVGFPHEAMCPAYGLAEAGVGIAFSPIGRGPRVDYVSRTVLARSGRAVAVPAEEPAVMAIVGCGYPLPGYEIRVAGQAGAELPERHEGRILCQGPSLTKGYFANPSASSALWQRGWLDTGDLGYLADGELFLTGRAKDIIIRGGRKWHPEDLEGTLRGIDGLAQDGVAVFSAPDPRQGTERLVVVAETDAATPEARAALEATIRRRAVDLLGAPPDEIVLVPSGAIRRTPSGKIRRGATREALESGRLGKPAPPVAVQLAEFAWSQLGPSGVRVAGVIREWVFAAYAWAVTLLVAAALDLAIRLPIPLRARWRLTRAAAHVLCKLTGIPVSVDGTMPPPDVPVIVVANHPSFVDAVVLILASTDPLTFVTSNDFRTKPVVGSFLDRLGCAFVARGEPSRTAGDVAGLAELVRTQHRLAVFPEGSINPSPGLRPFHLGAFAVAAATGCPIVPVAIRGTRGVVPPGSHRPRQAPVSVVIGSRVDPPGPDFATEAAVAEDVRRVLADMAGLPLVSA